MAKPESFTQVLVINSTCCSASYPFIGYREMVTWIPSKFAKVGKALSFKEGDDWTTGWYVLEVYNTMQVIEVVAKSRDYLKQRKASDI